MRSTLLPLLLSLPSGMEASGEEQPLWPLLFYSSSGAALEEESNLSLSRPGSFQAEIRAGGGGGRRKEKKRGGVIALYFPSF